MQQPDSLSPIRPGTPQSPPAPAVRHGGSLLPAARLREGFEDRRGNCCQSEIFDDDILLSGLLLCFPLGVFSLSVLALKERLYLREQDTGNGLYPVSGTE